MSTTALMWRAMTAADLADVAAIAATVHPDFPEDDVVFANRLALHPLGCRVLVDDDGIRGYVLSHPWHDGQPPALNSLLTPATAPSSFYIHDLALLPDTRGARAGAAIMDALAAHAAQSGFSNMTLVAVNNSVHFWQRQGFTTVQDRELDRKLKSYGEQARYMRRDLAAAKLTPHRQS